MINKRKYVIPILLTTIFAGINQVNAYTFGVNYADTGSHSTSKPREDTVINETVKNGIDIETHTCTYNYSISVSKNITINGYDIEDNEIMKDSLLVRPEDRILAGTSLGLNVYETKNISWQVTKAEATKVINRPYKVYFCKYKSKTTPQQITPVNYIPNQNNSTPQAIASSCSSHNGNQRSYYYDSQRCLTYEGCEVSSAGYVGISSTYYVVSSGADDTAHKKKCEETALRAAIEAANKKFYASYQLKMTDSNDINGKDVVTITNQDANKTKSCGTSSCEFKYDGNQKIKTTYTKNVKFYYNKNKVCINVKTAQVTYRNISCEKDEKEVLNKANHWHYFVPLNAKSDSNITINLLPAGNSGDLSVSECKYVMDNNPVILDNNSNIINNKSGNRPSYLDLIIPKEDGKNFAGNYNIKYKISGQVIKNESSSDYSEIKNGCRLTSQVKIQINQKFYNETKKNTSGKNILTLKGFNFYYKPIDINNPFPNGIDANGLWAEWNKKTNNNPDISKSYEEVTYYTTNIDANKIRDYTKKDPYTSWKNMGIDGKSSFIDNENVITRNVKNNFYKLGCGPSNEKDKLKNGTPNPLYIEGCDK